MIVLRTARAEDLEEIAGLLSACGLPLQGVAEQVGRFVVALASDGAGGLVGCVALEECGTACVLRSLAAHPRNRGRGVARRLIEVILHRARAAGFEEAYLLTRTIAPMAARHGFVRIDRGDVPSLVLGSVEFTLDACATATVMRLVLSDARNLEQKP